MSREKQIEEMDVVIRDAVNGCSSYWSGLIANALYDEGYRKQEWISVDERLPEKDGEYLVYVSGRYLDEKELRVAHFKNGDAVFDLHWKSHFAHWMPLPEAPKMKGGK